MYTSAANFSFPQTTIHPAQVDQPHDGECSSLPFSTCNAYLSTRATGGAEQQPGQRHAHLPAAGERVAAGVPVSGGEAQPTQHARHTSVGVRTTCRGQRLLRDI